MSNSRKPGGHSYKREFLFKNPTSSQTTITEEDSIRTNIDEDEELDFFTEGKASESVEEIRNRENIIYYSENVREGEGRLRGTCKGIYALLLANPNLRVINQNSSRLNHEDFLTYYMPQQKKYDGP